MTATVPVKIKCGHGTRYISCGKRERPGLDGIIIRGCKKKRSADGDYGK
jgi:hypothetical protein